MTYVVDKARWGDGPWQVEPDYFQWVDPATDLDCLIVRNSSSGTWCGYVGVSDTHPWYKVGYETCTVSCGEGWCEHSPAAHINVHGGLTYSDACCEPVCHVPEPGRPDDVWWFGFDCGHAFDLNPGYMQRLREYAIKGEVYRDMTYVQEQCTRLAEQLWTVGLQIVGAR